MQNNRLKELEILGGFFDRAEIPMVVLKGACFALTIDPNIGLRPISDLDVLERGDQLDAAVRIAQELGFVDEEPEAAPGLNNLLSFHVCLQKSGNPPSVLEIYDSLVADRSLPTPYRWSGSGNKANLDQFSASTVFENAYVVT
jgi:hypothetical protein